MTWKLGILKNGPHKSVVQEDGRLVSTYQRTILIGTDSGTVPTADAVVAATGISPGSPFEENAFATCRGCTSLDQRTTRPPYCLFEAVFEWSTAAPLPNEVDTDPTTGRVRWSIRPTIQPQNITEDKNKKPILNSAGQAYDGGVPVDARIPAVIARRKKDAVGYDRQAVMLLSGKMNDDDYLGAEEGQLQVDVVSDEQYEGGYHWWDEEYTISYKEKGWQPRALDAGFCQLNDAGKLVPIRISDVDPTSTDNTKMNEPEPLKDGKVVPLADRPAECSYITVEHFDDTDFDAFGLV